MIRARKSGARGMQGESSVPNERRNLSRSGLSGSGSTANAGFATAGGIAGLDDDIAGQYRFDP
jgi:hypothetical protein